MRRNKQDVLKDLPDKIVQDYLCDMTDVQAELYRQFEETDLKTVESDLESIKTAFETGSTIPKTPDIPIQPIPVLLLKKGKKGAKANTEPQPKKSHILQLLMNLRKICNHPMHILNSRDASLYSLPPAMKANCQQFEASGKFNSLYTLLKQFGYEEDEDSSQNQNKILIFTRFIDTIDLLSKFLRQKFPKLKHLRIDGKVAPAERHNRIEKFFTDFEQKIMLLTTMVGGLGLNLSCANIVIMFDHDFNPMNDLQAMDRAHRLGQKNVVNVYRLITKDT